MENSRDTKCNEIGQYNQIYTIFEGKTHANLKEARTGSTNCERTVKYKRSLKFERLPQ